MDINLAFFVDLFFHVLGMWWVVVPSILLGLFVGAMIGWVERTGSYIVAKITSEEKPTRHGPN